MAWGTEMTQDQIHGVLTKAQEQLTGLTTREQVVSWLDTFYGEVGYKKLCRLLKGKTVEEAMAGRKQK